MCSEVSCGAIAISGILGNSAWNYCISQRAFAQPGAEVLGGEPGVARKSSDFQPQPGANGNVKGKGGALELAVLNEGHHLGQFKVDVIGNGLDGDEGKVVSFGGPSDRRRFHVNGVSAIGFAKLLFLFSTGDFRIADNDCFGQGRGPDWSVSNCGLMAAAIASVNDNRGKDGLADF